jgi:hypothetical protein
LVNDRANASYASVNDVRTSSSRMPAAAVRTSSISDETSVGGLASARSGAAWSPPGDTLPKNQ